ncbi:hypothetical protein D3C78_1695650 [compost metagenome]
MGSKALTQKIGTVAILGQNVVLDGTGGALHCRFLLEVDDVQFDASRNRLTG